MTEALKLGGKPSGSNEPRMRRLNRLPIIVAIVLVVLFLGVIFYGLSTRGFHFGGDIDTASGSGSASSYADRLKAGVPDGIIGEPVPSPFQPTPVKPVPEHPANPFTPPAGEPQVTTASELESEAAWQARLDREQREQVARELQRQRMARLQADDAAYDSPIAVSLPVLKATTAPAEPPAQSSNTYAGLPSSGPLDLYAAALKAGSGGEATDPNGQTSKQDFFTQDIKDVGYLPNRVVPQISPYEVKRGSVIPATLVTGINSDLPGRITAQVSQDIYDSATGHYLLIPQGAKLLGRYDSKVSFGQSRVLVIWTDLIFPNGSTLQIGGMAGTDAAGYGGFTDQVDNHYLQTFGSAILVALIGAGTEMMMPPAASTLSSQNTPQDSARESFAETFGQTSKQAISKNMDVQPTLEVRPGYQFNVLVDKDMNFSRAYP